MLSPALIIALGALLAAAGVALGAFGAHALKARLPTEMLAVWSTGVQYHLWHALGMILVGLAAAVIPDGPWLRAAGLLLLTGIVLFPGSLYALALGAPKWLGPVTPLGGAAFLLGWLALVVAALRA
ncbi:MAG: DUF423 domain-containing protein [Betaproteobacteria bacterium]|nr:DUF423 domain-containing protein [Betaproteobacteria bacterium]